MPWENSPDGRIKHLIHRNMNTPELCVEAYMLFLDAGGRSGKHRHMWEELAFVVEGEGYDLHWDMMFDCKDKFIWEWDAEPKKFEWKQGDYIYVPPYTNHQSFATKEARIIVMSNRSSRTWASTGSTSSRTLPASEHVKVPTRHQRRVRHHRSEIVRRKSGTIFYAPCMRPMVRCGARLNFSEPGQCSDRDEMKGLSAMRLSSMLCCGRGIMISAMQLLPIVGQSGAEPRPSSTRARTSTS